MKMILDNKERCKNKNWEFPLKSCHLDVAPTFGVKYDIANYINDYNNNEDYWLPNPLIRIIFFEKISEIAYCQRIKMVQLREEYNRIRKIHYDNDTCFG